MGDPRGKTHAEATHDAYEAGLRERVLQVQGAVVVLTRAFAGDTAGMDGLCEILMQVGRGERNCDEVALAAEVERIVKGE